MSQKIQRYKNTNEKSGGYNKYYVRAVYDEHFVDTNELADYIQSQASVKRSDVKAVLDELGFAMKHFFGLGQKIRLDSIGIFKVGCSSIATENAADATAASVKKARVLFSPETTSVLKSSTINKNGKPVKVYSRVNTLVSDVIFEMARDANGSGIGSISTASPQPSPEGEGE